MKLLFVVHRYWPYKGGSEYYIHDMVQESLKRGHNVTVLTQGDYSKTLFDGETVSIDPNILLQDWDAIIVHGGDVHMQNIVHMNSAVIKSPIIYMIIKPSENDICLYGMKHATILAYSTSVDLEHIEAYNHINKARRIRHGIVPSETIQEKIKSDNTIIVSAGGWWKHKGFDELIDVFQKSNLNDTELHLYGYAGEKPYVTDKRIFLHEGVTRQEIWQAIANADLYVMNSTEEGFGLVLLEAMINKTPWVARYIAGAKDMYEYGTVYLDGNLEAALKIELPGKESIQKAYDYVMANHTIKHTINDLDDILRELHG